MLIEITTQNDQDHEIKSNAIIKWLQVTEHAQYSYNLITTPFDRMRGL